MENTKTNLKALFPVLLCFLVMGFVDMVGISVSYVKADFDLSDKLANLLPMMVFFWFAIISIPVGRVMGKWGRKKMVMVSAMVTFVAMVIPFIHYSFVSAMIAFALLGIGNTILQVSLNPLLSDIVPENKLTGMLAMGQFIKAIASTAGPLLIGLLVSLTGNWKWIFPIYAIFTLLSWLWLAFVKIEERPVATEKVSIGYLFKDRYLMMLFSFIVLSVGFEIGLITAVPKYLAERFSMTLEQGGFACSLYYIAKTIGAFAGSFLLTLIPVRKFQLITMMMAVLSLAGFVLFTNPVMICICLFLVGLTCANIFAAAFGEALRYKPEQANDISAIMIAGIAGGALLPPIMGIIADQSNQMVSLVIPMAALVYILIASFKIENRK